MALSSSGLRGRGSRSPRDRQRLGGQAMPVIPAVRLKPVVRFREFPFGTASDPSMREFMAPEPREDQTKVLAYLRSGVILGVTMGADLTDRFDYPNKANPIIDGRAEGG